MPQRFGQADDYSQQFAALYWQQQQAIDRGIEAVDQRREERQAADDQLMFTRYQEGKISGGELIAYIHRRVRQTSYDHAQQAKWKEALLTYGNQISDDRAETAYAKSGNISALITHYAGRLAGAAGGTPERRAIMERLSDLREQRDRENLELQARRISRQVQRGEKSTADLIAFYRQKLTELPKGSDLRQNIMDTLADLRQKLRQENYASAMTKIDTELASGAISPQEAADQIQGVLNKYNIKDLSPTDYWAQQEKIRAYNATPDPAVVAKLDFQLEQGQITPEDYMAQMEKFARQIAPFDVAGSWELRQEAQNKVSAFEADNTPLENPGALGLPTGGKGGSVTYPGGSRGYSGTVDVVRRLRGKAIAHITQLDGSSYSQFNCTMASGAMLAYAMTGGQVQLSGADLRYSSGVTAEGSNIAQLKVALERNGVTGTKLFYDRNIEFDAFKQRVMNGAPAVLSGWLGDIPAQFNTSGIIGGHAMFVAGYDPKRNAFLMLDPAKSSDSGTWWPASIVRDFGWVGQRNGDVLFAPRGTLDPKAVLKAGANVRHISVDAKPTLNTTPPTAGGRFDPGPDLVRQSNKAAQSQADRAESRADTRLRKRLEAAGIQVGPDLNTKQKVEAELERRNKAISKVAATLEEYQNLWAANGEDTQSVTIGTTTTSLSRDEVIEMTDQLLYQLDGTEVLYDALGNDNAVQKIREQKAGLVKNALTIQTPDVARTQNRLLREMEKSLTAAGLAANPKDLESNLEHALSLGTMLSEAGAIGAAKAAQQAAVTGAGEAGSEVDAQSAQLTSPLLIDTGMEALIGAVMNIAFGEGTREEKVLALQEALDNTDLDVNMPTNWQKGFDVDPTRSNTLGRVISNLLQRGDDQTMLTPDENGMTQGTMVYYQGQLVTVPYITTNEYRAPNPETGEPGGFFPVQKPDLSILGEDATKGLELIGKTADEVSPIFISDGKGGVIDIPLVPDVAPYAGITFLQLKSGLNDKQLALLPDVIRQRYLREGKATMVLTGDELRNPDLNKPGLLASLRASEIAAEVPYLVEMANIADHGQTRTWFRDPADQTWYIGNLPWTQRLDASEANHYTGAKRDDVTGAYQPELVDATEMDDAFQGVEAPYANDISPAQAQKHHLVLKGQGVILDSMRRRRLDNPEVVESIDQNDERFLGQYTNSDKSLSVAVRKMRQLVTQGIDRAIEAGAVAAEDTAFFDDLERKMLLNEVGIDPDTGDWKPGMDPHGADAGQTQDAVLEGLGVHAGQKKEPKPTPKFFDPMEESRTAAVGVRRKIKEERARRKAIEEEQKLALPTIKAPLKAPVTSATSTLPKGYVAPKAGSGYDAIDSGPPLPTVKTSPAPSTPSSPEPTVTRTTETRGGQEVDVVRGPGVSGYM